MLINYITDDLTKIVEKLEGQISIFLYLKRQLVIKGQHFSPDLYQSLLSIKTLVTFIGNFSAAFIESHTAEALNHLKELYLSNNHLSNDNQSTKHPTLLQLHDTIQYYTHSLSQQYADLDDVICQVLQPITLPLCNFNSRLQESIDCLEAELEEMGYYSSELNNNDPLNIDDHSIPQSIESTSKLDGNNEEIGKCVKWLDMAHDVMKLSEKISTISATGPQDSHLIYFPSTASNSTFPSLHASNHVDVKINGFELDDDDLKDDDDDDDEQSATQTHPTPQDWWPIHNTSYHVGTADLGTACSLWPSSYIMSNLIWVSTLLDTYQTHSNSSNNNNNNHTHNTSCLSKTWFSLGDILLNRLPTSTSTSPTPLTRKSIFNIPDLLGNNNQFPIGSNCNDQTRPTTTFLEIGCGSAALPTIVTARLAADLQSSTVTQRVTDNQSIMLSDGNISKCAFRGQNNIIIDYTDLSAEILHRATNSIKSALELPPTHHTVIKPFYPNDVCKDGLEDMPDHIFVMKKEGHDETNDPTIILSPKILNWLSYINLSHFDTIIKPLFDFIAENNSDEDEDEEAEDNDANSTMLQSNSPTTPQPPSNSSQMEPFNNILQSHDPIFWSNLTTYFDYHPARAFTKIYTLKGLFDHGHSDLVKILSEFHPSTTTTTTPSTIPSPFPTLQSYDIIYCSDIVWESWHALAVPMVCQQFAKQSSRIHVMMGNFVRCEGSVQLVQLFITMMYLFGFICVEMIHPSLHFHPNNNNNNKNDLLRQPITWLTKQIVTSPEFSMVFVVRNDDNNAYY